MISKIFCKNYLLYLHQKYLDLKIMKTRLLTITFILSAIIFISCSKEDNKIDPPDSANYPVAAFSFSGNDGPAPVTVQFTNYSEVINLDSCTYTWTFGEHGPQSHIKDPSFTFSNNTNQTKSFPVTLKVHDLISDLSQSRTYTVPVKPSI